jgi:hypothetical protein
MYVKRRGSGWRKAVTETVRGLKRVGMTIDFIAANPKDLEAEAWARGRRPTAILGVPIQEDAEIERGTFATMNVPPAHVQAQGEKAAWDFNLAAANYVSGRVYRREGDRMVATEGDDEKA